MKKIYLKDGQSVLVDDEDFELVSKYRWRLFTRRYKEKTWAYAHTTLRKNRKCKCLFMHRLILDAKPGQRIDHINHSGLDNRRSNLRFCTHSQNLMNMVLPSHNTSGHKGVCFRSDRAKKWSAEIYANRKRMYLGSFPTKDEAIAAYMEAARVHHGEFLCL